MNYAELPDEYGLSQDSLRGSADQIQHDLVGVEDRTDPFTRRPVTRGPLSRNELLALHSAGRYVDENGEPLRDPSQLLVNPPIGALTVAPVTGGHQTLPGDAPGAPTRYTPEEFVAMMRESGMTVSMGDDRLRNIPTTVPEGSQKPVSDPIVASQTAPVRTDAPTPRPFGENAPEPTDDVPFPHPTEVEHSGTPLPRPSTPTPDPSES